MASYSVLTSTDNSDSRGKKRKKNKNKNGCLPKLCRALKVRHFSPPASGAATTANSTSSPNPLIWTMAASWCIGSGWDRCEETTTRTSKGCFCGLSCHCALLLNSRDIFCTEDWTGSGTLYGAVQWASLLHKKKIACTLRIKCIWIHFWVVSRHVESIRQIKLSVFLYRFWPSNSKKEGYKWSGM